MPSHKRALLPVDIGNDFVTHLELLRFLNLGVRRKVQ